MKQRFTFLIVCVLMVVGTASAQQTNVKRTRPQFTPEQRMEIQTKQIVKELMLDDKTSAKFIPLYQNYLKELYETHISCSNLKVSDKKTCDGLTDSEISQRIENRFKQCQNILDLRVKYYNEFKKILQPRQIQRMYHVEKSCMNSIKKEYGCRSAHRHGAGRTGKAVCPPSSTHCND